MSGVLGGILLAGAVVLFLIGLVPAAIFIGIVGIVFIIAGNGKGSAGGFSGCLIVVFLGVVGGCCLIFRDEISDKISTQKAKPASTSSTSSSKSTLKSKGNLSWEHRNDGGFYVCVSGRYTIDNGSHWDTAWLYLRKRRNSNGYLEHEVYVDYGSKIVPNSLEGGYYGYNKGSKMIWQRGQCSTGNTAMFFLDNNANDRENDVVNLLNGMNGGRYFAAQFRDHRNQWIFAEFDITGAFSKYRDLEEGCD